MPTQTGSWLACLVQSGRDMQMRELMATWAARGAGKRLARAIPFFGIIVAAFYARKKVKAKGFARGGLDTALDFTPVVGRMKAVYEFFRGDIIAPRAIRR